MNKKILLISAVLVSATLAACGGSSSEKTQEQEGNQAPVVVLAETDVSVEIGASVTLDASASTDAESDALSFSWTGLDAVVGVTASSVTLDELAVGEYSVTVSVSDGDKTSSATVNITVQGPQVVEVSGLATGTTSAPVRVYYDLDSATELLLTEQEAEQDQEWDVAFERTKIFLNRYAETPVEVYFTGNTEEFYDESGAVVVDKFVSATATSELDAFIAETGVAPVDATFNSDIVKNAIEGFYNYDFISHTTSANDQAYFIVSSDTAYSKFRVKSLVQNGFGIDSLTLGVAHQTAVSEEFSSELDLAVDATACDGDIYIDFANNTLVAADADWDISIPCAAGLASYSINIADDALSLNDDVSALVGVAAESARYYDWVENEYEVRAIAEYGAGNKKYGWAEYGVNGGHVMWPNFATFIIKTAEGQYKFQVVGYYDAETGASGVFTIRHQKVIITE
ncbi:PKD domain-containing protein [Saccharophagus degradans]|uniref:PKD domain-containing protein n=1 Tax=Saccharophagus degradans TaxID=86304 RepID=UPI0024780A13|nr:PKD domain-containing protein [Saccharophagus degradans]WGO97543.1 PKD domain-containing protein [Saccharophagus degradans]